MAHAEKQFRQLWNEQGLDVPEKMPEEEKSIVMRIVSIKPRDHHDRCRCTECQIVNVGKVVNAIARALEERSAGAKNFKNNTLDKLNSQSQRITHLQEKNARHIADYENVKNTFHKTGTALDALKKRQDELDSNFTKVDNAVSGAFFWLSIISVANVIALIVWITGGK